MNCFHTTSRFICYFSRLNDVFINLNYELVVHKYSTLGGFSAFAVVHPRAGMHAPCPTSPCHGSQIQVPILYESSLRCYLLQKYFADFSQPLILSPGLPVFAIIHLLQWRYTAIYLVSTQQCFEWILCVNWSSVLLREVIKNLGNHFPLLVTFTFNNYHYWSLETDHWKSFFF